MGYEVNRFQGDVDEELLCPICSGVLEEPLQAPQCEHAFCSACINEWLSRQQTCPVDRNSITPNQLQPVPRILRNLLSRLYIGCDNATFGCTAIVKLDLLLSHLQECEHNPKKPVHCEQGCGLTIPKDEVKEHNCVRELRGLVQQQQGKINDLQTDVAELKLQQSETKREVQLLKEYMRAMRVSNPRIRELQSEMENDDVLRWVAGSQPARVNPWGGMISTPDAVLQAVIKRALIESGCPSHIVNDLMENAHERAINRDRSWWVAGSQPARVNRWGGMISTPDAVLQAVIKRALIESGCPSHIVNDLMENAHERRWPTGLSTLETRQLNRRQYENYVTKRIPGKQAVVVMACENQHVSDDMIMEPGLVMIFAHGVE